MTHDPLLNGIERWEYEYTGCDEWQVVPNEEGRYVLFADAAALIARVREDEHTKRDANGFWPPAFQGGYTAALRDAVSAVEALDDGKTAPANDGYAEAIAAIKSLGGES